MKLIVGLGNPGNEYENTRHNIGFMCLKKLVNKYDLSFDKKLFNGLYTQIKINDEKAILLLPQKYMNLSGEVVRDFMNYFKININDILIISDDLDMDLGRIKLKYKGSSGGHNGLKNIEQNIGSNEYKRIKVGISNNKSYDTRDYVLGSFNLDERKIIDEATTKVVDIMEDYFKMTFDNLMNKYN